MATRIADLGPILLKSCFLERLKRELKFDVKLLKPANVYEAIALAVQLDTKHSKLKKFPPKSIPPIKSLYVVHTPTTYPVPRVGNLAIKKLTPEEIQSKREKGECWFCTDKWTRGHKCGVKQFLMLDVVNDESVVIQPELLHIELSECVFYSTKARQAIQNIKVDDVVNGQAVKIFLDSGSTHNFIDPKLLKQ